jgi:hypothetical protein
MDTTDVYRVEDIDGAGAFTSRHFSLCDMFAEYQLNWVYPFAVEDCGREPCEGELHAVKSLELLAYWFPAEAVEEMTGMARIKHYRVDSDNVTHGKFQLIFDPVRAELVEDFPVSKLFELVPDYPDFETIIRRLS